jgi:hypothetical protein
VTQRAGSTRTIARTAFLLLAKGGKRIVLRDRFRRSHALQLGFLTRFPLSHGILGRLLRLCILSPPLLVNLVRLRMLSVVLMRRSLLCWRLTLLLPILLLLLLL